LTFTEAGNLARIGFNAAGIAISTCYLESDRDFRFPGIPLSLIRRKVLEQQHLADAIRIVATTPKACSNNLMISHSDGFAVDFECAPDESFAVHPQDDLLVHANHWVSGPALAKLKETGLAVYPDSVYRDWRVRRLLEPRSKIRVHDVKSALFDNFGAPYAVCRPPLAGNEGNAFATVATVVMDSAEGAMEVAAMPAEDRSFTQYNIA
jgi:isopenicillin-N N-acyltransferase-like protein